MYMSTVVPGDRWSVGICEDVIVWEFASARELQAVTGGDAAVFRRLVDSCDVPAMVTILDFGGKIDRDTLTGWGDAGRIAVEGGIRRWAIVAEDANRQILEASLENDGLETLVTANRDKATAWARSR